MKEILLTKGYVAFVDDADFDLISKYKWYVHSSPAGNLYAYRNSSRNTGCRYRRAKVPQSLYNNMHGMIMKTFEEVDHIDGNGLNNQRDNLRIVTRRENSYNRVGRRGRRFKGISYVARRNCWRAYITPEKKQIWLGYFKTEEEAAHAYDKKAKELWGEYARLNFTESLQELRKAA